MTEEKLFRIKTKEGAHINEKINEDGSRAALQFDENNALQGPVDLIEVDESEYKEIEYVEVSKENRELKEMIFEDAVVPALEKAIDKAFDKLLDRVDYYLFDIAIPKAKSIISEQISNWKMKKKATKSVTDSIPDSCCEIAETEPVRETIYHTPEEIDKIVCNMKYAALYFAAGIRELSNTIVTEDMSNPEIAIKVQKKIKELTSEECMKTINLLLEDGNRDMLDQYTQLLFRNFQNQKIYIPNEEPIPISQYLNSENESII